MKVQIIYKPQSEHATKIEEFVREIGRNYDRRIPLVDADSKEGARMAELYDIVQYPAIIALSEDGSMLKDWQGPILPLMNEVVYYASDRLQG